MCKKVRDSMRCPFQSGGWNSISGNIMTLVAKMDMVMCPVSLKSLSCFALDMRWMARRYLIWSILVILVITIEALETYRTCLLDGVLNCLGPAIGKFQGSLHSSWNLGTKAISYWYIPVFSDGLSWYRCLGEDKSSRQPNFSHWAISSNSWLPRTVKQIHVFHRGGSGPHGKGAHAKGRHYNWQVRFEAVTLVVQIHFMICCHHACTQR